MGLSFLGEWPAACLHAPARGLPASSASFSVHHFLSSLSLSISTSLSVSPKHTLVQNFTWCPHHLVAAGAWGSGPCSHGKRRWSTPILPRWARRVGITGSCGANELEVCVSEVTPPTLARPCSPNFKSEVRLRGLGGCKASLLGEQRERVMGLERGGQSRRYWNGRAFLAEGAAFAKALGQDWAWRAGGTEGRLSGWSRVSERERGRR